MNKLLNCQNQLQIAFDCAIIITVTGTALVTTNIIAARTALNVQKGLHMARPRKEGSVDRNTLITRTVTLTVYEVTYLPIGSDTVHRARETVTVNEQAAKRLIRSMYKDKGFIVSIAAQEAQSATYAQTIEDFVKNGFILETNTKNTEVK